MRLIAILFAGLTLPAAPAVAQSYARSWNTVTVRAPIRPSNIVTSALPAALPVAVPGLSQHSPHAMHGVASYYWQGQMTASGERFDRAALTAAHRTLPMQTRVKVTHVESGRSVVVRINDRGPFKPGRVIDLSDRAADILGFKSRGLAHVRLEVIR